MRNCDYWEAGEAEAAYDLFRRKLADGPLFAAWCYKEADTALALGEGELVMVWTQRLNEAPRWYWATVKSHTASGVGSESRFDGVILEFADGDRKAVVVKRKPMRSMDPVPADPEPGTLRRSDIPREALELAAAEFVRRMSAPGEGTK